MKYPFLDLAKVNAPYIDEIRQAVVDVIDSGRYIGGPAVDAFEEALAKVTHTSHAVGVSNGLDALRLIFRAYIEMGRMAPGDEVIVPANTYIASILALTDNGLTPVLVDADPSTLNIDTALIEQAVTERTRAILTVHLYGRAAFDHRLLDVARRHHLLIVEDNAQAIGAQAHIAGVNGHRATGSLGHAAAISFYPTKNIGAMGDAGAVTTCDSDLAATVRALANYGCDRRYHNLYAGLNCRLDPMQAALLTVKLRHLEAENGARFARAVCYGNVIDHPLVTKPLMTPHVSDCVWHQYVVQLPPEHRDRFIAYLADNSVGTDIHYPTPPHRQPCYSGTGRLIHGPLPVTERLAASMVSLPISPATTVREASEIARIINRFA